ncbi:hypothetical protein ABH942_002324 [Flavobacterium sp. 28YEA47A]
MYTTTIPKVDRLFLAKKTSVILAIQTEKLSLNAKTPFYGILLQKLHLPIRIHKFYNSTINLNF